MSFVWFLGVVEDITDPAMLGRVRVRIINENDSAEINTEDLLWAFPISPIQSGSLSTTKIDGAQNSPGPGAVGVSPTGIEIGSYAFGFFMDGEERNHPLVFGTYHRIPDALREQIESGAAAESAEHDVSLLARGTQSLFKEELGGDLAVKSYKPFNVEENSTSPFLKEPASAFAAEYPHNKTTTTKSGHAIEVDDTPGEERLHTYHRTGTYTEVNKDGRRVQKITGSDWEIVVADKNLLVKGALNIEVDGNATILVKNNAYTWVGGNAVQAVMNNVSQTVGQSVVETVGKDVIQVVGGNVNQTIQGNVSQEIVGDQNTIIHGDLKYAVDGDIDFVSKSKINFQSVDDMKIGTDADLLLVSGGDMSSAVTGNQVSSATITEFLNSVDVTGTVDATVDVVAGATDISLTTHTHGGVATGGGSTGAPNA